MRAENRLPFVNTQGGASSSPWRLVVARKVRETNRKKEKENEQD